MLRYAAQCCAMLRNAALCCAMLRYAALCCAMPRYAALWGYIGNYRNKLISELHLTSKLLAKLLAS